MPMNGSTSGDEPPRPEAMHPTGSPAPEHLDLDAVDAVDVPARLEATVGVQRGQFRLQADVQVAPGQVLAVLGPNGAGKSTLLRALAGLLPLSTGRIEIGGDVWDDPATGVFVPAVGRTCGLVFQDYRLFPHLSVRDNVAFPIRARGAGRRRSRQEAAPWVERLGVTELAGRRPAQLSGGQAQRVALARALAGRPRLLLLDEPLAALDARTRLEVRSDLRRHLSGFPGPSLVVTHDPLEALVLADRVLVLEAGRVVQEGPPTAVARRPATEYVARLVGLNLYAGSIADRATHRIDLDDGGTLYAAATGPEQGEALILPFAGTRMLVAVAPTAITLHTHEPDAGSARNRWTGRIAGLELLTDRVRVAVDGYPSASVDVTPAAVADLHLHPGQQVWLTAKATEVTAYPDPGGALPPSLR
jgi:molybdate transport system ATP-binding protein